MPTVCLSSTQNESGALTRAGKEAVSAQSTMRDFRQFKQEPTCIFSDSLLTVFFSLNAKFHTRTQYIEVSHHLIGHLVYTKQVKVVYVSTEENLADLLTKGLNRDKHKKLMRKLGLVDCNDHLRVTTYTTKAEA